MSTETANDKPAPSLRPEQMKQSRVGKRPVALPKGVTVTVANGIICASLRPRDESNGTEKPMR